MNPEILSGRQNLSLVVDLCKAAGASAGPNYSLEWVNKPHTLLWQIREGYLAQKGADYLILVDDQGRPLCGAGYYEHPSFTVDGKQVTVVMVRMWTHPEHRLRFIGTSLLRCAAAAAKTALCLVSFNHHNKALHDSLTGRSRGLAWPPEWRSFTSIGLRELNHTPQWCAVAPTQSVLT